MPLEPVLLTPGQLESVREAAKLGMVDEVTILRRTPTAPPVGDDYGDDFIDYVETTESKRTVVKGWFYSKPTTVQSVDTGQIITVNTYRLFLPVGTDIEPGDEVTVRDHEYTVSDTTAESTWLPLLNVTLRRRE